MYTTHLRKVGGSIMLCVPPIMLDVLHLQAGAKINLILDGEQLLIRPVAKPRYTLDALLAQCDATAEVSTEEQEWVQSQAMGKEIL